MAICLHPYLIGVPHRIAGLDSSLKYMRSHAGVALTLAGVVHRLAIEGVVKGGQVVHRLLPLLRDVRVTSRLAAHLAVAHPLPGDLAGAILTGTASQAFLEGEETPLKSCPEIA